jgi:hypothetical protein
MDHATIDETIVGDRIAALLSQEKSYACPNYLSPDYMHQGNKQPRAPALLRILEECAKLVTDLTLISPTQVFHGTKSPSTINPAAFVASATQVPSATPDMQHCKLASWRRQMCSWAYDAVDTFELDRELVAFAFDILDRYIATEAKSDCVITREDFQLFSMTCLYTAIKILEPTRKLSMAALIGMSRGYYCAEDIAETEMEILETLEWRVNPPTALTFVGELLSSSQVPAKVIASCRDHTEMAVMDEYFVPHKASTVAVAAVLAAARQHDYPSEDIMARVNQWMDVNMDDVTSLCEYLER